MKSSELKNSKVHIAIAKLLKDGRENSRYSLDAIEERTKINRNQLWCYENNTREPSVNEILALFDFYKIDIETTMRFLNELRKD